MSHLKRKLYLLNAGLLSFALLTGWPASGAAEVDLASFDLEDLLSIEVTSISKKSERAFEAPAAAFVITSEDIRRSGLRSIPELLRMVPGVQVAQLSASQYAISVRGFNGNFSDKLLVLIDGRSVYTPLFAGVWWDVQDLPLADVDRIEVIRGPGGTVWGANAVNGVINIVTKSAAQTQGWHVEVGIGNYERGGSGVVRYGGRLSENVDFRVYLKHFDREKLKNTADADAGDAWDQIRTGFRMDAKIGDSGEFTLQGDLYDGSVDAIVSGEATSSTVGGGNILARYTHEFSDTHNASAQFYYDRTDRNASILIYELDTFDVELKHQIAPLPWLDLVWGGEYRHYNDDAKTRNPDNFDTSGMLAALGLTEVLDLDPRSRKLDLFSGFIEVEGRAWDERIRLTVGTKLEDNDTSGFELQPSARLAFVPNETMTIWGSTARAVRTPSRSNDDFDTLGESSAGVPLQTHGNRDIESEDLMAYEAGIRAQPTDWLHLDLAGFYFDYDDVLVQNVVGLRAPVVLPGPVVVVVPDTTSTNNASAVSWGIEFFARAQVLQDHPIVKKWWIDATYSYLDVDLDLEGDGDLGSALGGVLGEQSTVAEGRTESHHSVGLRSHMSFVYDLEFDVAYSFVSKVNEVGKKNVPSYHRVDLRTAWRPTEHVEASFSVENLFDAAHKEWNTELFISGSKIPRTVYGKLTLTF